ncbi:trehalose-phosphatase [Calidifontibacter sp. DB0510]|uniref:Trehalose 6-phosphate phosphatase n=1 Tax=Metallococcus carri TaxID=1656884 RepID=A0A967E9S9_9MICO|nr:trehalose-phosphatase [Metallococcus carri]NHN55545.1 trehalose-phosphatase [Metallococcus carri]NOP38271.1 trehalose-phosphatase [Calidifontibacter sp. DB2511S]
MTALSSALASFAGTGRVLVASDFDGVLAPLVMRPDDARALPQSLSALRSLAGMPDTAVAIVSGRDLATLRTLTGLTEDDPIVLIGSHGGEPAVPLPIEARLDAAAQERLARATAYLEQVAGRHPGTRLEHKPANVVLHTRGLSEEAAAAAAADGMAITQAHPDVHVMAGKSIVEAGVLDVNKGVALTALAQRVGAEATLYLGDDVTDETAFAVLPPPNLTVKVGPGKTAATQRIPDPEAVASLLADLADLRRAGTS